MVGKARHIGGIAGPAISLLVGHFLPIRLETEAAIGPAETMGETGDIVGTLAVDIAGLFNLFESRIVRAREGVSHDVAIGNMKTRIVAAQPQSDGVDDLVVGAGIARRIDHFGAIKHAGVTATGVVVVVL